MERLVIVRGNTFYTRTKVKARTYSGSLIQDFDLSSSTDMVVTVRSSGLSIVMDTWIVNGNFLDIKWEGIPCGAYGLDVRGVYNGVAWRFYNTDVLEIVESNSEANIPEDSIISEGFYLLDDTPLRTSIIDKASTQSDWNVNSSSDPAYIRNKPTIPTKVSDLTNDSGYQTAAQVQQAISEMQSEITVEGEVLIF